MCAYLCHTQAECVKLRVQLKEALEGRNMADERVVKYKAEKKVQSQHKPVRVP